MKILAMMVMAVVLENKCAGRRGDSLRAGPIGGPRTGALPCSNVGQ
jgi:hypothetical protein